MRNRIELPQLYQMLLAASHHVQNRTWNALYNYLMGSSILVLAWSTMYGKGESLSSGSAMVLVAISVVGIVISLAWAMSAGRSTEFMSRHTKQAKAIERNSKSWGRGIREEWHPIEAVDEIRARWNDVPISWNSWIAVFTPMLFSLLYVVLLVATVGANPLCISGWISAPSGLAVWFWLVWWVGHRCEEGLKPDAEQWSGPVRALGWLWRWTK